MARRNSFQVLQEKAAKERIGAFRRGDYGAMVSAINILRDRAVALKEPELTAQEMFEMWVPERFRATCIDALYVLGSTPFMMSIKRRFPHDGLRNATLVFHAEASAVNWRMPADSHLKLNRAHPAWERVREWALWRMEVGQRWGFVKAVLIRINREQPAEKHAAFHFPAVPNLLRLGGQHDLAAKLEGSRIPDNLTAVPLDFKEACAQASAIVAGAHLLPKPGDAKPVRVGLQTGADEAYATTELPWGGKIPAL